MQYVHYANPLQRTRCSFLHPLVVLQQTRAFMLSSSLKGIFHSRGLGWVVVHGTVPGLLLCLKVVHVVHLERGT